MNKNQTVIIAHRGASALAEQENTIEAFQIAIDLGCEYAEFDIRRTKDRQLVAFHNNDLNGTLLRDLTYQEICEITRKEGYKVPLLREVLALCSKRIKLDIELKETGYEKEVINLVKKYYDYPDYMMKSFIDRCVFRIKEIDPNIKAGLLIGFHKHSIRRRINEYFPMRRLKACKADFISPNHLFVTREFVHRMHRHKKNIYVWTVNEQDNMKKLLHKKVDGIITDRPDIALEIRADYTK